MTQEIKTITNMTTIEINDELVRIETIWFNDSELEKRWLDLNDELSNRMT